MKQKLNCVHPRHKNLSPQDTNKKHRGCPLTNFALDVNEPQKKCR
jgi:hypothetical protein